MSKFDTDPEWIETDTLPIDRIFAVVAAGDYDYYEWQILGDTTTYKSKQQTFAIDNPWGELTMRLIVRSKPDTLCFPFDDGIDTAYR